MFYFRSGGRIGLFTRARSRVSLRKTARQALSELDDRGIDMKRVVLIAAGTIALVLPSASLAGDVSTKVTLDFIQTTPGGTIYTGDIFSSAKKCKNERRVTVFRVTAGKDDKRGSTLSYKGKAQPGYYWAYEEDGIPPAGDYYAKVRPTDGCKGDRSPIYPFPN